MIIYCPIVKHPLATVPKEAGVLVADAYLSSFPCTLPLFFRCTLFCFFKVYDPKTLRYDQPYATGNCAGEGICGTCFVEVRSKAIVETIFFSLSARSWRLHGMLARHAFDVFLVSRLLPITCACFIYLAYLLPCSTFTSSTLSAEAAAYSWKATTRVCCPIDWNVEPSISES